MIDFKFSNYTGQTLQFSFYEDYTWKNEATMIISVADSLSVSSRFQMTAVKKDFKKFDELVDTLRTVKNILKPAFPEGSPGLKISFDEPQLRPEISLVGFIPYMQEGDEQVVHVEAKNLDGEATFWIEGDCAKVYRRTKIKALKAGTCTVKYGTDKYNKSENLTVEARPQEVVEQEIIDEKEAEEAASSEE